MSPSLTFLFRLLPPLLVEPSLPTDPDLLLLFSSPDVIQHSLLLGFRVNLTDEAKFSDLFYDNHSNSVNRSSQIPSSLLEPAQPVLELSKGFAKPVKLDPNDQARPTLQRGWGSVNRRAQSGGRRRKAVGES